MDKTINPYFWHSHGHFFLKLSGPIGLVGSAGLSDFFLPKLSIINMTIIATHSKSVNSIITTAGSIDIYQNQKLKFKAK